MPQPDPPPNGIESAIDELLVSRAAVEPPPEAVERWRRSLRRRPAPERCLGLSARSWAAACAVCLLLAGALAAMATIAWRDHAVEPPRVVFAPPAAPVIMAQAAPPPIIARQTTRSPNPAAVIVPASARVASPTAQEQLLTRLAAQQPATLAELLKGLPAPTEGEQQ